MKFCLDGPYPFDVNAVTACGRAALSGVDRKLRADLGPQLIDDEIGAEDPGLYVVCSYEPGDQPDVRIAGFWVAFGTQFLEDGVLGPPDRYPPYAHELLDSAVEEVWWRNLQVARQPGGSWHPVIVLEWPHPLASRAALYPPGVTIRKDVEESMEILQSGVWLGDQVFQQGQVEGEDGPKSVSIEHHLTPFDELPGRRSLVAVIRGQLSQDRVTHQGGFRLLPPSSFPGTDTVMLRDQWLAWATSGDEVAAETAESHRLGRPLSLAPGRIGFPLSGWLTRNLELWPAMPREVVPADLTERVVRSRWRAQLVMAAGSTLAVLSIVLGLSLSVQLAAKPRPRPTTTTPLPATQPAMSVCSADHQKFVAELRCQVEWFAQGGSLDESVCGDPESVLDTAAGIGDLQAAYCGLLDRERDGWKGNYPGVEGTSLYNYAELAASQACYNVLGHPHPYTQPVGYTEDARSVADPDRFLQDRSLRIQSLVDLVADLDEACDAYRGNLEQRVDGAVFATHVGTSSEPGQGTEASRLRDALVERAVVGMSDDAERCFRLGTDELLDATEYAGLCGPNDALQRRLEKRKIWGQLGAQAGLVSEGEDERPLLERYVEARFGGAGDAESTDLWQCHLALSTAPEELRDGRQTVRWDLSAPVPVRYDTEGSGAVRSQLVMDALLSDLEDGSDAGVCWAVVDKRLDAYTPVHPLLADLDDDVWVSPEQQLCGQICASYYRVRTALDDDRWVTRGADLARCLDASAPPEHPELRHAGLDRLRLPWSETRGDSWVQPGAPSLCAFNLVAQDYIPAVGEAYLVGDVAPAQWAGETYTGSRIAGGDEGLSVRSAKNLSSYGRSRSSATCGYVATQCLTGMMLDVMGEGQYERYEWQSAWRGRVASLAAATPMTIEQYTPWCQLIQPYLHPEGMLPEGEIDYPCAAGVDAVLHNVEGSIRVLAQGSGGSN